MKIFNKEILRLWPGLRLTPNFIPWKKKKRLECWLSLLATLIARLGISD